jgi:hypothetical protein
MKNNLNTTGCTELSFDEMLTTDGGSKLIEDICYALGRFFATTAKMHEKFGDNGQWMM